MFSIRCFFKCSIVLYVAYNLYEFKKHFSDILLKKLYQIPTQYQKIDTLHNILI